ncbi:MAG: hypothetical protein NXH97_12500 [Rhodobacteraceae bacterium]|nr:hypothetical protein [Paracoccaceae bacterium]
MITSEQLSEEMRPYLESFGVKREQQGFQTDPIEISKQTLDLWNEQLRVTLPLVREHFHHGLGSRETEEFLSARISFPKRRTVYPLIARPDCIINDGKLKLIELNFDSGLGGIWQTSYVNKLYRSCGQYSNLCFSPIEVHFAKILKNFSNGTGVVLAHTARLSGRNLLAANTFAREIENITNIEIVVSHYSNIDLNTKTIKGISKFSFDAIYRLDWLRLDDPEAAEFSQFINQVETSSVRMLSDTNDMKIEDKISIARFLDDISTDRVKLGAYEKDVVLSTLVPTYLPSNTTVLQSAREKKDSYVIKKSYTSGGEGVTVGAYSKSDHWEKELNRLISSNESFVLQERVVGDEVIRSGFCGSVLPGSVFGPYFFDNDISGILVRYLIGGEHAGVSGLKSGASMGICSVGVSNV